MCGIVGSIYLKETLQENIDADLRKKLKRVSLKENITLNVLLLSAFITTLNKISKKEEYLIAVPFSNRLSKAEQECIGYLSNTLFIRSTVNSTKTFSSLAKQLKSDIIQILDHQQIPFDELIKILRKNGVNLTMHAFKLLFTYHQKDKYSLKNPKYILKPIVPFFKFLKSIFTNLVSVPSTTNK